MTQGDGSASFGERRFSRRTVLKAGGGGVAAAVITGLGVRTDLAAAAGGAPLPGGVAAAAPRNLLVVDPHAHTGRSVPARVLAQEGPRVRILPITRARFLALTHFDLRVEATGIDPEAAEIAISVTGPNGPAAILVGEPETTMPVEDSLAVTYHHLTYWREGTYTVAATVSVGGEEVASAEVRHEVVVTSRQGARARNVVFFLGDGMGTPVVTAARILSKGISEGKYHGLLELDQADYRGLVGTSGFDSIATDSANSMSAYMTGHKSSVNAMGVYEDNDPDPNLHPRVETIGEIVKRARGMSVGVVTTSEIQDATPAAVWAHTRRRAEYVEIMDQALNPEQMPDVLMGGGLHTLLPQSEEGSRRADDRDLREEFAALGFTHVTSRQELAGAMDAGADRLLGTFQVGNMNVYLNRQHAPNPDVLGDWTDQPNLMEMTEAALKVLGRNPNGFFLVVEAASIDKMEHPLDGPRAVYDTIEFDQAVGVARRWAEANGNNTLIVVTADHNHSMSIVGTHDKRIGADPGREANGVYADARYPTYVDSDGDGFPDDPAPEVELFFGWSNHPDHTDDFNHNPVFLQPALIDADTEQAVDNPNRDPGALLQVGNLPYNQTNCVHTVEDVSVFAYGPGAARFNAFQDNTEIFFGMAEALHLVIPRSGVDLRVRTSTSEAVATGARTLVNA